MVYCIWLNIIAEKYTYKKSKKKKKKNPGPEQMNINFYGIFLFLAVIRGRPPWLFHLIKKKKKKKKIEKCLALLNI